MVDDDIFLKLNKKLGGSIPTCLVKILKISGFESAISLRSLNSEKIIEIEEFVNSYKDKLDEINLAFDGTIYLKVSPFKFTPGHRSILLEIPNSLEQKKPKVNLAIQAQSIPRSIHSEKEQVEENLRKKASLIAKLKLFLVKQKIQLDIKEEDIVGFHFENNQYKCKVKCSSCDTVTAGFFDSYWAVSNIEKHFKRHTVTTAVEDLATIEKDSNTDSNSCSAIDSTQSRAQVLSQNQTTQQIPAAENRILSIGQSQIDLVLNQIQ